MFKERYKRPWATAGRDFFLVIGLVALILALSAVSNMLRYYGWFLYGNWATIAIVVVIGGLLVNRRITEFQYLLGEDRLLVDRVLGSKEKTVLTIPLDRVISLTPGVSHGEVKKSRKMTYRRRDPNNYELLYRAKDGAVERVIFSPSARLVERMGRKLDRLHRREGAGRDAAGAGDGRDAERAADAQRGADPAGDASPEARDA
ncbi:MAG: hypothetical protein ACOYJA_05370 [Christensenellales bacterium]